MGRYSLRIRPSLVCRLDHDRRPGERFLSKHEFRFRFVIILAFLLFGCEQDSIALSGDSEIFEIAADSPSDSTSASSFVGFGGGFCAGILLFPSDQV